MTLAAILVVAAALIGIGVYGALSQQSFVMIMMGIELMLNGGVLAAVGFWAQSTNGGPKGQLLVLVGLVVMGIDMAIGFAVVVAIFRSRQVDMTEGAQSMKH